jgi:hypothetical protein
VQASRFAEKALKAKAEAPPIPNYDVIMHRY